MIHILQLLCPQRHCFVAVAWDDAAGTLAGASVKLANATVQVLGDRGHEAFVCAICGSTSFHQEDGITRWETMAEAAPHLLASQAAQLLTREMLTRTADRN
jgi:hypothetical protein